MIGVFGSIAVALLLSGASIGLGSALLARLGLLRVFVGAERVGMTFAVGFGTLGWLMFFLAAFGWLERPILAALVAAGLLGLATLLRAPEHDTVRSEPFDGMFWMLVVALAFVLVMDFCEGLSPPADADSLAYHFALPKQFLVAGRLEFVPRAVDGAVPLLPQMTYLMALALGGEHAMTLWTMITGWMPALLFYGVCRPDMSRNWSLAAALVVLTTPAMLYGGGSGQIEPRLALLALAGSVAVARAIAASQVAPAALAGLLAGFVAASKYTGLLFVAACAVPLLFHRRAISTLACYGIAATLAGLQWYGWNYAHSGDPIFPMLFEVLRLSDSGIWTQAQHEIFRATFYDVENPLPRNPLWFLIYPFHATLWPVSVIESGRTGLGPVALVLLPFALLGVWRGRARLPIGRLAVFLVVALGYYTLWYVTGSSQRVRHLLIVYPLLLAILFIAAARWSPQRGALRPIAWGVGLALTLQLGGATVYAANYVRHLIHNEGRDAFFSRSVQAYDLVPWINANLSADDKILITERQLVYLIDIPVFYAHQIDGAVIGVGPHPIDPAQFWRQLQKEAVTHVVSARAAGGSDSALARALATLVDNGCAQLVHSVEVAHFASRTFANEGRTVSHEDIFALRPSACRL